MPLGNTTITLPSGANVIFVVLKYMLPLDKYILRKGVLNVPMSYVLPMSGINELTMYPVFPTIVDVVYVICLVSLL